MIEYKVAMKWTNREKFEKAPELFQGAKREVLTEAGALLEKEIAERTPVGATGLLKKSIASQVSGNRLTVGTPLEYAEPVEYGTRPHWAPLEALELWGVRKLGSAEAGRAVWYTIGKKGTRAALMFTRAWAASQERVMKILQSIGDRIVAKLR